MAESYQAARADNPEILNGLDIYFFVADFSLNQNSFQQVSRWSLLLSFLCVGWSAVIVVVGGRAFAAAATYCRTRLSASPLPPQLLLLLLLR